ncbi:uncharacterized protein CcaverHIS019_0406960 [Cutaneotrichosporon cavernicola]|uniref:3-oxo-5-alpha-steroid 4-dehydrogenase C-terminal domain-containing protein n=1 Tax=Cutaneotrichosporon cavernicola TaxID=279322 RepID=A0AA48QW15_9TREE|nr:uncharacterized protein CcaverHIS019_0406960 [Cutaneotrichosporon cavernicola]BEI91876.1 hypothetical protein CcaverHIS019_0406960 [Cutaneotrichosporon cavernicola]BEI99648.1 hypothetical protein CcaverHIS631_0406910 [Cutaneotrichosporon cavernicola]BEJ07422.1 hypothetical protein CcaverHIS641_0406910 [Cutaneotrichosporon cavernicola]
MQPQPPPDKFYPLLLAFHIFPIHAPITLWLLDAPFGKFAIPSILNLPGNAAWAAMELVAPYTFWKHLDYAALTPRAKLIAAAYLIHYAHRALISPLLLAPRRAPLHLIVIVAALVFNGLNASLLGLSLPAFPPPGGVTFWAGMTLWAAGFLGNIYHDEILHDLRRSPEKRLVSAADDDGPTDQSGKYRVPRGGLFALVSFPNYLCEWLEWIGLAIAAAPDVFITVPPLESLQLSPWVARLIPSSAWPRVLLAAPWAFVLAEVTSMLPRALRGHAWYQRTFAEYPAKRKAAIPWLL